MKKIAKLYIVAWVISLCAFNIVAFVSAANVSGNADLDSLAFWAGYVVTTLTLLGQLGCFCAFWNGDLSDRFFLRISLWATSYISLVLTALAASVVMMLPSLPSWIAAVISIVLLACYMFACLRSNNAENKSE